MYSKLTSYRVLFFITMISFVLSVGLNTTRLEFASGFTTGLTIVLALATLYFFAQRDSKEQS